MKLGKGPPTTSATPAGLSIFWKEAINTKPCGMNVEQQYINQTTIISKKKNKKKLFRLFFRGCVGVK